MVRIVVLANPSASQFTGGAHRTVMSILGKVGQVEAVWPESAADLDPESLLAQGRQVFDSGDELEEITAVYLGDGNEPGDFNSTNDEQPSAVLTTQIRKSRRIMGAGRALRLFDVEGSRGRDRCAVLGESDLELELSASASNRWLATVVRMSVVLIRTPGL